MRSASSRTHGFTLLELLVIIIIAMLGSAWVLPQYRRQLALSQLDQYSQQIETGLYSLRARQSAEGTSCEISINPSYVGIDNSNSGFGAPTELLELSHLKQKERDERLKCCDATTCEWNRPYKLMSREGTSMSKSVGVKFSKANYLLSPPGTSTDGDPLIILIRAENGQDDPKRPLPLRCVKLSTTGHLHRGTWEESRCRRR